MKKFMRAILLSTLLLMTTTVNFAADNNLEVVSIFDFANKITDQMDRAKPKYGYYSVPVSLQGDLTGRITSISILKQDADDPSFTEDFSKAINQAAKKYALPKNFFLDNSTVTINFRIQPRGRSSAFVVRTQESPVIPSKGASATFATDAEKEKIIREADKNIAKTNSSADPERVEGVSISKHPQVNESVGAEGAIVSQSKRSDTEKNVGIYGNFRCSNKTMVDMISGRAEYLSGNDITTIYLNGSIGVLTQSNGKKESLTFSKKNPGPKATGYIYIVNNSVAYESIQMNIDNVFEKKLSALLTNFKPMANTRIVMTSFCDY